MFDAGKYRAARLAGGFTFREVAEATGVDPSTIASYEAGRGKPSAQLRRRWEEALRDLLARRAEGITGVTRELAG